MTKEELINLAEFFFTEDRKKLIVCAKIGGRVFYSAMIPWHGGSMSDMVKADVKEVFANDIIEKNVQLFRNPKLGITYKLNQ